MSASETKASSGVIRLAQGHVDKTLASSAGDDSVPAISFAGAVAASTAAPEPIPMGESKSIVVADVDAPPLSPHPVLSRLVSRFARVKSQKPYVSVTIGDMLAEIAHGYHYAKCLNISSEPDLDNRRARKQATLEAVSWAGVFKSRKPRDGEEILVSKSGAAMLDFDDVRQPSACRDALAKHPHVLAAWISSSGGGVQALVLTPEWCLDRAGHEAFMRRLLVLSSDIFGCQADVQCADLVRLSYESCDQELRINHAAVPFSMEKSVCLACHEVSGSKAKIPKGKRTLDTDAQGPQREAVIDAIRFHAAAENPGYDLWLKILSVAGMVMPKDTAVEFLKEVFPEKQEGEYEYKLDHALDRITPDIFLAQAKAAGWKRPAMLGLSERAKAFVGKVAYMGRDYMAPVDHGYVPMRGPLLRRHLTDHGVPAGRIDDVLTHIEKTQSVHAAIDLFGRKSGITAINGYRILVGRDTTLMTATPGECPTVRAFLSELFGDQLDHFLGWLQKARRDFAAGRSDPGTFLFLIGDVKTGKSLLLRLIVLMLGERYASGFSYLTGKTDFNAELITCGIIGIDDELDGAEPGARSKLRARLKAMGFSRTMPLQGKGRDTRTVEAICRFVILGNATEEVMQMVPSKTADFADKAMLLKAHRVEGGTLERLMKAGDPLGALKPELPAFLDHLERFELPKDKTDLRTGVASFWHSELVRLMSLSDEHAPIIDYLVANRTRFAANAGGLSAGELLSQILTIDGHARTVLGNATAVSFGKALARIAQDHPDLLRKGKVVHKTTRWEVLG